MVMWKLIPFVVLWSVCLERNARVLGGVNASGGCGSFGASAYH